MTEQYQVCSLGDSVEQNQQWDAFVDTVQNGTFFHLSGWKRVIENVYQHPCHYIYATEDQKIVGVLPLVEQKSRLFGHALISTPFCMNGGVAADSEEVMLFLEQQAIEKAHALGVDYLELRYPFARNNPQLTQKCAHSTFGCELAEDHEQILANVKKKQRAVIRHSLKNDLSFRVDNDTSTAYEVYSESVRNLGTPVFPKRYFAALQEEFGERCDVLTVQQNDKALSSVLSFYYKDQVLPFYGGGLFEARASKSNDYMYYQLMCHAKDNKACNYFDFGRSKNDSGAFKYKRSWGMEPIPLHYHFHLVNATELPNLSPNNPKYQFFIKMWQKLPVWLSRRIGPFLSKYLG
ncbi:FemAB family XrtA/PEP-CTERM system-associated protein [Aliiglaciecola sp. LCG003]|uniref:FemAB family XrtA/PEP-CTERM system-associated protein n=1 Tax=Aliiglaciecola sp. LCG003 TaxID=3053655 RepID=UPI002572C61C|nr:FemAB family XrtA/PEP-CTERM system-associated protein [Aliiglaciecola sp. LCG003]WJG10445.1 FemAB family PEP-CTERM system-associated protein [Aliiglaciecola sp. LCG003]